MCSTITIYDNYKTYIYVAEEDKPFTLNDDHKHARKLELKFGATIKNYHILEDIKILGVDTFELAQPYANKITELTIYDPDEELECIDIPNLRKLTIHNDDTDILLSELLRYKDTLEYLNVKQVEVDCDINLFTKLTTLKTSYIEPGPDNIKDKTKIRQVREDFLELLKKPDSPFMGGFKNTIQFNTGLTKLVIDWECYTYLCLYDELYNTLEYLTLKDCAGHIVLKRYNNLKYVKIRSSDLGEFNMDCLINLPQCIERVEVIDPNGEIIRLF